MLTLLFRTMPVTYTRVDEDRVRQTTTTEPRVQDMSQSEIQTSIDELCETRDMMPVPRVYPDDATVEEMHEIDMWNVENSNKVVKERLVESIVAGQEFLDLLKAV